MATKKRRKRKKNKTQKLQTANILLLVLIVIIGVSIYYHAQKGKQKEDAFYASEDMQTEDMTALDTEAAETEYVDDSTPADEDKDKNDTETETESTTKQEDTNLADLKQKETSEDDQVDDSAANQTEEPEIEEVKPSQEPEKAETDSNKQPDADADKALENIGTSNSCIELSGLSTESLSWGQGLNFDEYNRPAGCLNYQNKYGQYNAYYIVPKPEEKIVYLTFDEGYEYGCTPEILQVLREKNAKAVFFITQSYAKKNPDLVKQIIADGHILGNHSVTHPANGLPSQSLEQQKEEIMGCHQYVKDNFGVDMHLFRYPAGIFSEQSLALVNNCGYKSLFWSFAYRDYDVNNQPDEGESLQKLVDRLHPGAIYLLHAESTTNTHILGELIDQGRAAGYSFEPFPY